MAQPWTVALRIASIAIRNQIIVAKAEVIFRTQHPEVKVYDHDLLDAAAAVEENYQLARQMKQAPDSWVVKP